MTNFAISDRLFRLRGKLDALSQITGSVEDGFLGKEVLFGLSCILGDLADETAQILKMHEEAGA